MLSPAARGQARVQAKSQRAQGQVQSGPCTHWRGASAGGLDRAEALAALPWVGQALHGRMYTQVEEEGREGRGLEVSWGKARPALEARRQSPASTGCGFRGLAWTTDCCSDKGLFPSTRRGSWW